MSAELKPCPFCGGESHIVKGVALGQGEFHRAYCAECQSRQHHHHSTAESAIEAWNRRALAAPSQPAAMQKLDLTVPAHLTYSNGTAEPVAPRREAEERCMLDKHFANRAPSQATADFDLPAPNDPIEPVAQAARDLAIEALRQSMRMANAQGFDLSDDDFRQRTWYSLRDTCAAAIDALAAHPAAEQAAAESEREALQWMDVFGCKHTMTAAAATALLKELFDEWPGGMEEIQAARRPVRELTDALQYAVDIHTPGRTDGPTHHHIEMFLRKARAALSQTGEQS